jgi:hypothetical protein
MMPTVLFVVARIIAPLVRAAEGGRRSGPFALPITGGWLSAGAGQYQNWWQMGFSPTSGERSAVVERCMALYAQTGRVIAGCPLAVKCERRPHARIELGAGAGTSSTERL